MMPSGMMLVSVFVFVSSLMNSTTERFSIEVINVTNERRLTQHIYVDESGLKIDWKREG